MTYAMNNCYICSKCGCYYHRVHNKHWNKGCSGFEPVIDICVDVEGLFEFYERTL